MFISDFFSWISNADIEAKLILFIGIGGMYILYKQHKQHEEANKNKTVRDVPEWTKKYIRK